MALNHFFNNAESKFMNTPSVAERFKLQNLNVTDYEQWVQGANIIKRQGGTSADFVSWSKTDPNWNHSDIDHVVAAFERETISVKHTMVDDSKPLAPTTAAMLLGQARDVMEARAKEYDKPEGERSMDATTLAFNAITGRDISESEGWLFMSILKMVRDRSTVAGHRDSCEDLVAYASLYGESRLAELAEHNMVTAKPDPAVQAVLREKFAIKVAGQDRPAENLDDALDRLDGVDTTPQHKPSPRKRMIELIDKVREKYGKDTALFIAENFGSARRLADVPHGMCQEVVDAIHKLYGSDFGID